MGTSFDCPCHITEHEATGKMFLGFGPFDMGDLQELLIWIGSEDGQDKIIAYAAKLISHNQNNEHRPGCRCHYCDAKPENRHRPDCRCAQCDAKWA